LLDGSADVTDEPGGVLEVVVAEAVGDRQGVLGQLEQEMRLALQLRLDGGWVGPG
jgi:hypothetical protein